MIDDVPIDVQRLAREKRTLTEMIRIYCSGHRNAKEGLCPECIALHEYAMRRLDLCPFGGEKPACSRCPIHCYQPQMRERVRAVMRYAGPRMLLRHPVLAVLHKLDDRKNAPEIPPPR